ncbi:MAG: glycosyltransferase [Desulfobacteraceae bacterium]|nr:glycosyltransferase [Desulfobacteraceae bacterium]
MSIFRIFCAIPHSANNYALQESNIWYRNIAESLIKMGHEVVMPSFQVGDQYRATYKQGSEKQLHAREEFSERLVREIRQAHKNKPVDLILTYYNSNQIMAEAVDELRQIGPPVINYSCNNAHQFHLISEISPHFDFCIVPEKQALEKYKSVGANPLHIQMAANPYFYRPFKIQFCYDATFVGQKYLNRPEYIHYLCNNGISARVWGPNWRQITPLWNGSSFIASIRHLPGRILLRRHQRQQWKDSQKTDMFYLPETVCGGVLSDDDMVKMYSKSKISLNFSEVKDEVTGEIKRHIRLRDFEGPMSGAFYMTGYQEELAEYYDIGREIVCYNTKEDLLDKVKYYLAHSYERDKIRDAGYQRTYRDHTWEQRFNQLFSMIGIRA